MTFRIDKTNSSLADFKIRLPFRFFDDVNAKTSYRLPKSSGKVIYGSTERFAPTSALEVIAKPSSSRVDRISLWPTDRSKTGTSTKPTFKSSTLLAQKDHTGL
jgi:hypothetical protein